LSNGVCDVVKFLKIIVLSVRRHQHPLNGPHKAQASERWSNFVN
jgi:hypothetical protein